MDNSDKSRYPKFAQYVRCALPEVVNVRPIVRAFQKYGQIDRATLKRALAWDAQPRIEITDLEDAFGEFNGSIDANLIKIDTTVVEDFEAGRGIRKTRSGHPVYLAGVTLLHELVHWADNIDGIDFDGSDGGSQEEGDRFEIDVYGGIVQ